MITIERIVSYIFVLLIYYFITQIIRMVYMDIKSFSQKSLGAVAYLKLLTSRHKLGFEVKENYPVTKSVSIGRGRSANITIDDPYLSMQNSAIIYENGIFYLEDLSSENGTILNDEYVTGEPIELRHGDHIRMGSLHFAFMVME